jgi:hypothetical protein
MNESIITDGMDGRKEVWMHRHLSQSTNGMPVMKEQDLEYQATTARSSEHFNPLKPSGYYKYQIPKLSIRRAECICVFRMALTINSDCSPEQH